MFFTRHPYFFILLHTWTSDPPPPLNSEGQKSLNWTSSVLVWPPSLSSSSVLGCIWLFWIIWLYYSLNEHHMKIFTYRSNNNKALMLLWNAKRNQSGKGWEWGWGWGWQIWENPWNANKTPAKPEGIMQAWWHPVLKNPHLKHWLILCSKKEKKSKWKSIVDKKERLMNESIYNVNTLFLKR